MTVSQLLLSMPGGMEWVWILLVVVILFGGKKIPELARGIGKGIRDFNEAKNGVKDEISAGMKSDTRTTTTETPASTITTTTNTGSASTPLN